MSSVEYQNSDATGHDGWRDLCEDASPVWQLSGYLGNQLFWGYRMNSWARSDLPAGLGDGKP